MQRFSGAIHIAEHPLMRRLSALDLDRDHFVIFGSGPLLVYGLRSKVSDLDIVARGSAWDRAKKLGELTIGPLNRAPMVHFWGGLIEVSRGWVPDEWDADKLIDEANVIEGFRFATLPNVLRYKRSLKRAKDIPDIVAIEAYLRSGLPQVS